MPKQTSRSPDKEIEKIPSISRIIAEVNKKAEKQIIGRITDMVNVQGARISTGIKELDSAIGGGFPCGRIIELYGFQSTGKSLISLLTIKEAQKQKMECVYIDAEDTFDKVWAEKLGVDTGKLIISPMAIGEDIFSLMFKLIKARPGIIVLDSIASMITRKEMEEDVDKVFMAPRARLMSKGLSMLNALNKETCLIFINQLRSTMNPYSPWTTSGGNALRFYASIRLEIKKTEDIHEEDKKTLPVIGQVISFKVTKNKTAPPLTTGRFRFFYKDGRID